MENTEISPPDAPLDLPRHVAFICDGNSRWAERRGLPESMGHAAGADRVTQLIKTLHKWPPAPSHNNLHSNPPGQTGQQKCQRIECCTLFAFSTENWSRPQSEIIALFKLMEKTAIQYRKHDAMREGKVQIEILGDLDDGRIPEGARRALRTLQEESRENCNRRREGATDDDGRVLTVCLAINYGGRADILRAAGELAKAIAAGELPPNAINDEVELSKRLRTSNLPDPDLIVRTGGERRLSNFLLWDAAYAELYFTDDLWPDFDEGALGEALEWYGRRKRRFGGRKL
ncbi:hypothetical protein ACHAXT_003350 [Thalassiosira profunda]